jgi:hypothetical protein
MFIPRTSHGCQPLGGHQVQLFNMETVYLHNLDGFEHYMSNCGEWKDDDRRCDPDAIREGSEPCLCNGCLFHDDDEDKDDEDEGALDQSVTLSDRSIVRPPTGSIRTIFVPWVVQLACDLGPR